MLNVLYPFKRVLSRLLAPLLFLGRYLRDPTSWATSYFLSSSLGSFIPSRSSYFVEQGAIFAVRILIFEICFRLTGCGDPRAFSGPMVTTTLLAAGSSTWQEEFAP